MSPLSAALLGAALGRPGKRLSDVYDRLNACKCSSCLVSGYKEPSLANIKRTTRDSGSCPLLLQAELGGLIALLYVPNAFASRAL